MKKGNLTRTTAFVLLLAMISLSLVSGTLAKYATEFNGTDTAIVAKWDVDVQNLSGTTINSFNLFESSAIYDLAAVTVPEGQTIDQVSLAGVTGVRETDVKEGKIIAPGTWGKIGFKVVATDKNDVTVKCSLAITGYTNTSNIPLEFSTDGSTWEDEITDLTFTDYTIAKNTAETKTYTIYWRWLYEQDYDITVEENTYSDDAADTLLGTLSTRPEYKVTASFGATQVD